MLKADAPTSWNSSMSSSVSIPPPITCISTALTKPEDGANQTQCQGCHHRRFLLRGCTITTTSWCGSIRPNQQRGHSQGQPLPSKARAPDAQAKSKLKPLLKVNIAGNQLMEEVHASFSVVVNSRKSLKNLQRSHILPAAFYRKNQPRIFEQTWQYIGPV